MPSLCPGLSVSLRWDLEAIGSWVLGIVHSRQQTLATCTQAVRLFEAGIHSSPWCDALHVCCVLQLARWGPQFPHVQSLK